MHFVKIGNEGINLDLVTMWRMGKAIKFEVLGALTFEEAEAEGQIEDLLILQFSDRRTTFEVRGDEAKALYNHLHIICETHIVTDYEESKP